MAQFGEFAALWQDTDRTFRLPDANGNRRTFRFNLPNLDPARTVIIMFKVAMSGNVRLQMRINDNPGLSIDFTLDPPPGLHQPRSWHEIIGPNGGFRASGNVLSVLSDGGQGAEVAVSDIVFLYHARTGVLTEQDITDEDILDQERA